MLSLVIPIYKNEDNLPRLFAELETLAGRLLDELEAVFVVDGSPDRCLRILQDRLPHWSIRSRLLELSRNFGSFAAITAGLAHAGGEYMAVCAADLQEPPELILDFHSVLCAGETDIVLGCRTGRADPWWSRWLSHAFWHVYGRIVRDMPPGGVDAFACTAQVRDRLVEMRESDTNLIALLLWLGFRRRFVGYRRRPRLEGRSAWTLGRKMRYAVNSVFNFTDLPVRVLLFVGVSGTAFAVAAGATVFVMWALGRIPVLGYAPLMLAMMLFGGLTALGLGIVGQYLWLSLQNVRRRPAFIVRGAWTYRGHLATSDRNSS